MNADVETAINQCLQWFELATSLKQCLGNSPKEYEKCIVTYSINNQLRYRENLIRFIYKDEKKYYEELLNYSRTSLMMYPYHLADVMVKGLRVTAFQYYVSIIEWMIDNDKSYDSIPNFSAIDCLRLLGIGRNEYIELMNKCRTSKKLFRRKNMSKNLLPSKPVDVHLEPWWLVETGFITDEDIKFVSDAEKDLIDNIIDNGMQRAGQFNYQLIRSLYGRGLIYLEIPISDDDYFVVLTLEGFVMNRVQGDYLEKLLYKILVSIDERTSVGELATLLQMDPKLVHNAVSLACRLNLAKKKVNLENIHLSWNEIVNGSVVNGGIATIFTDQVIMEDLLLKELNEALAESSQNIGDDGGDGMSNKIVDLIDSVPLSQKRIAFFFDSTLTAFLMMGNLSPDLKKHAVKMFEVGKLTNEDLDEFLNELKNVSSVRDESEGEAKRYFDHALILRETVLALRSNSTRLIDLIRCESLQSLDQEIDRFLVKNYFLLVSMAPLSKEVRPIVSLSLPHLGPATATVNTIWFKLFLYKTLGCGPSSILFPRGTQVKKIPKILRNNCDRVLLTSWGHEPISLPISNMLLALNDALLYTPVLVQCYGKDEQISSTSIIPFPFKEEVLPDLGIKWLAHDGIVHLNKTFNLNYACGYVTMLRTNCHRACKHLPAEDIEIKLTDGPINGIADKECEALLQQELDNSKNFSAVSGEDPVESILSAEEINSKKAIRRVKLPISSLTTRIGDWCVVDCVFGVPLFDTELNDYICKAIVQDGLWHSENLEKLVETNQNITIRISAFIKQLIDKSKIEDDYSLTDDIPWPLTSLMFQKGELLEWDGQ